MAGAMSPSASQISLDRMVSAVEKVRQRLLRATAALKAAGIDYAVAGGNAVAAWVSTVDESAVRNTQDVDILIRREDLDRVKKALESAGFIYRHSAGLDVFLDGLKAKAREAVHIIFSEEMVRPHEPGPNPKVTDSHDTGEFTVLDLEALVRVKLTAYRRQDQVHIQDLIEIGLIDSTWLARFEPPLAARLQVLLDTPEG
jgi:hypothetical protein